MGQSNNLSIGYSGSVKLTTLVDNKVVSEKVYKNSGMLPLFTFIGNCLIGNFNSAGRSRPFKIMLLEASGSASVPPNTETTYEDKSNFIEVAMAPELIITNTSIANSSCQVKFSFIFPVARVFASGANVIALYGLNTSEITEFSAYHRLTKPDPNNPEEVIWDPIELQPEDYEENKVFAVEWTMTISNKS